MSTSQPLPPADIIDPQGEPRWGTYTGPFQRVDLAPLARRRGPLFDTAHHKRWIYAGIATDDLFVGMAITDLRYAANAFLFVASTAPGASGMLADYSAIGVPRLGCHVGDLPEEGCDAWFRLPRAHLSMRRPAGQSAYDIIAHTPQLSLYATLETRGAPAPHGAVVRPEGSEVMVTEKRVLMPARGVVVYRGQRRQLDGGFGGIDYSQGFPPRETTWRWGFFLGKTADGQPIGLNLVQGFNGQPECVVWLNDTSYPLGEGRFSFDEANPLGPWSITTDDGKANLTFEPAAIHQEAHDLGLVSSRFLQPIGTYRGTIEIPGKGKIRIDRVCGVAEDQRVRW